MEHLLKRTKIIIISWLIFISAIYLLIGRKINFAPSVKYIVGILYLIVMVLIITFIKEKTVKKIHVLLLTGILLPIFISLVALAFFHLAPLIFAIVILLSFIAGAILTTIAWWRSIKYFINFLKRK